MRWLEYKASAAGPADSKRTKLGYVPQDEQDGGPGMLDVGFVEEVGAYSKRTSQTRHDGTEGSMQAAHVAVEAGPRPVFSISTSGDLRIHPLPLGVSLKFDSARPLRVA